MVESSVGDLIAQVLEAAGVSAVYGVVSIHNMPILDAIGRRGAMRLVASRGEAGAVNMADAYARVTGGLGVAVTSTGTAAGNAAGALVEALTAGSPVLHLTGQIESEHLDLNRAYIHEAPAQLDMLRAVSKGAWRITGTEDALPVMLEAIRHALTPPTGPVSIEIPIDLQAAAVSLPDSVLIPDIEPAALPEADVRAVALALKNARRPMLLLGGGARDAGRAAQKLANMGVGIVTSTSGRAIVPEDHPRTLGAFNVSMELQSLYRTCDCFLAVGTRLRSNETWTYKLVLPEQRFIVNCDPGMKRHAYSGGRFIRAHSRQFLEALVAHLGDGLQVDPAFGGEIAAVRAQSEAKLRDDLGVYSQLVSALQDALPEDVVWVRDVTISNSMWGNRLLRIAGPRNGVHAVGGGIGQGAAMAVGASIADRTRKVVALCGDGGFTLNLGELITAAQENANVTILLMNDRGYGVIKNIQDAHYGGRRYGTDIMTPDFGLIARSLGIPYQKIGKPEQARDALRTALSIDGPAIVEVDMLSIGPFKRHFIGPPVKT